MSDILENDRRRALCCACGNLRTVSKRNHGRVRGSVANPFDDPAHLSGCQSRGVFLDVELHWRYLGTFKCHICDEWTQHALVGDESADDEAERRCPVAPASYYQQLEALEELGGIVCWAPTLRRAAIWVPSESLLILNSSRTRAELVAAVASLWPGIVEAEE